MAAFPYEPRPGQRELAQAVADAVTAGGHLVAEAATGSGKTVALLAGALEQARKRDLVVLYVTRTNSQQAQAITELKAIQQGLGRPVPTVALQGRNHLCLKLLDDDPGELAGSSPEDLSHYCSRAKRKADEDPDDPRGCSYWARLSALDDAGLAETLGEAPQAAEELLDVGRANHLCPYEAAKRRIATSRVVIAPYIYAFEPNLRARLLEWWRRRPDEVVLVVDEAHNLPDYVRNLFSPRLTVGTLRLGAKEALGLGDAAVLGSLSATAFLEHLKGQMVACVEAFCTEDDAFLPPFELEARLMEALKAPTPRIHEAARTLATLGEVVRDRKRQRGKVPRSSLLRIADFLLAWFEHDESTGPKIAGRDPDAYLESYLVDTTRPAAFLDEMAATVHASGTLQPLQEYVDSLGLDAETTTQLVSPPPFPDAVRVVAVRGVTTRYESLQKDPRLVDRLQDTTRSLVRAATVKLGVFFPSHRLLNQFSEVGVLDDLAHPVAQEVPGMPQAELMRLLATHRAADGPAVLAAVLGGRLTEGIDYPGDQLEALLVVGAPYPKPTARQRALLQWFDRRTGKGWDYAVATPAIRRLRQALGRLQRGPTDRGLAVLLDERCAGLLARVGMHVPVVEAAAARDAMAAWPDDTLKAGPRLGG